MKRTDGEKIYGALGGIDNKWLALADDFQTETKTAPAQKKNASDRHFVLYEFKKLLGVKYLWIFLAVLFVLNSGIAYFSAGKTPAANEPSDMISEFFRLYFENSGEYDRYYEEISAFNEEQNRLMSEAMHNGDYDFEPQVLPDKYSTDPKYSDTRLFTTLYAAIKSAQTYPDTLQKVINRAKANLAEFESMGIPADSYTYKYQLRVIELYEQARDNVKIGVEYTRGWDEYFAYDIVNVFIFVMLIMAGSLVFAQEKQSGFMPIIKSARFGRARTAVAKILTMFILSSFIVLLFTAGTFAVYGLRIGFSSPDNALQALGTFTLSPFEITVGQYFLITVLQKLFVFAVFSVLMLLVSVIFYNYILIYVTGLGVFGLNFLLYTLKYINANSPAKNLNFVAASAVNPLFVRFRSVNFFGGVFGYVPFMLTVFGVVIALACAVTVLLYVRGVGGVAPAWLYTAYSFVAERFFALRSAVKRLFSGKTKPRRATRAYTGSIFAWETFKTLLSSRFIVIVALLLCVKVWVSADSFKPVKSYSDAVYKEYMTALEGEVTDEKLAYLAAERARIDATLAEQETMKQAYINETVTYEEYREYLNEYNYAYSRSEYLREIENHAEYLLRKEAETGVRGWFVYDTGWTRLLTNNADLFLYSTILLLLCGVFASEYTSKSSSGGFARILRATKHGRNRTFGAKLTSAVVLSAALAVIYNATDLIIILKNYTFTAATAPLLSVELFGSVTGGVNLVTYTVLFFLLRIAAAVIMALLVSALSELLCRYIPVLGSAVVLTLLPALCAYFGFAAADKVNYLNLLAGTPIFLQSATTSLGGNDFSMLLIWLAALCAIVAAALYPAKKMFVK